MAIPASNFAVPAAVKQNTFAGTATRSAATASSADAFTLNPNQTKQQPFILEGLSLLACFKGLLTFVGGALGLSWVFEKIFPKSDSNKVEKAPAKGAAKKPKKKSKRP